LISRSGSLFKLEFQQCQITGCPGVSVGNRKNLTGVLGAQCATLQGQDPAARPRRQTPPPDWCTGSQHPKTWSGVGGQPSSILPSHDVPPQG
jgi:hypothetical protein